MAIQSVLKVNQENLVKNLRFGFADAATVLGELMQNARRAGATKVEIDFVPESKTLAIRDDGCGIDSFQTLLTVAESGWDADTIEREHPFGIGFLAALFACDHLTVESKGKRISMPTEDILSFKPVTVMQAEPCNVVTAVRLDGFKPDAEAVVSRLTVLAEGFPVPAFFNGETLKRPKALDSGREFIQTPIGKIYLKGLAADEDWRTSTKRLHIYLQGLPVYRSSDYWRNGSANVVHLDPALFRSRLPDRDKLIDEDIAVSRIKAAVRHEAAKKLRALKESLAAEAFAEGYETLRLWGCLALLNDVPIVPRQALAYIQDYPIKEGCSPVNLRQAAVVAREDVETGKVVVAALEDFDSAGAAKWMYAWRKAMLVYDNPLDLGHWLHRHLLDLNGEPVAVEVVGEIHRAYFDGHWVCGEVVFCEKYRLAFVGDAIEIEGDSIYLDDEEAFVVPKGDACGGVVRQACSYFDEYDSFNESVKDEDEWAFEKFVVANASVNPAKALARLLPSFTGCPKVFGKRFTLELDASGKIVSVAELADGELADHGMEG